MNKLIILCLAWGILTIATFINILVTSLAKQGKNEFEVISYIFTAKSSDWNNLDYSSILTNLNCSHAYTSQWCLKLKGFRLSGALLFFFISIHACSAILWLGALILEQKGCKLRLCKYLSKLVPFSRILGLFLYILLSKNSFFTNCYTISQQSFLLKSCFATGFYIEIFLLIFSLFLTYKTSKVSIYNKLK